MLTTEDMQYFKGTNVGSNKIHIEEFFSATMPMDMTCSLSNELIK